MTLPRLVLAGAAATLLAPAAAADAATLTTAPCYIEQQPMTIQGTGWGPGSNWSVKTTDPNNQVFDYGTADTAGNFTSTAEVAPLIDTNAFGPVPFTLTGQQDDQDVATTGFSVVHFLVEPKAKRGRPTKKTTWRFSGFTPGQPIYVHVRRKGKTHTQRAGVGSAPCGILRKKLRRLPAWPTKKIAYGIYHVAVDNRKAYTKSDGSFAQFTAKITISKTFKRT